MYIFLLQINLPLKIIKTCSEILNPSGFQVNMHLDFEFDPNRALVLLNWRNPECVSPLTKESVSHLNGCSLHKGLSVGLLWHRCNNYGCIYTSINYPHLLCHNFSRNWCLWPPKNHSLCSAITLTSRPPADPGDKESVRRLNLSIKPSRLAERS